MTLLQSLSDSAGAGHQGQNIANSAMEHAETNNNRNSKSDGASIYDAQPVRNTTTRKAASVQNGAGSDFRREGIADKIVALE